MPEIKFQHVVSFSSEDKNFAAENLLKGDNFKKWKGLSIGSKQETVTLQLDKAERIHQVDIGNESSAFIEVLVGRSSSKEDEFKVLLVASSFMNPLESRKGTNANRVRIFSAEKLNKSVMDEKWDRLKVVCTQPFNRNVQYGLTFIRLHSPPSEGDKKPASTSSNSSDAQKPTFGAFGMKAESRKDDIKAGSLFANKQKEKSSPPPLTAAAVRAASKLAEESIRSKSPKESPKVIKVTTVTQRGIVELIAHFKKPAAAKFVDSEEEETDKPSTSRPPMKRHSTSVTSVTSSTSSSERKPLMKRTKTEPAKQTKEKELNKVLKGVVFVMSGFQNPKRSDLRDAAVEMGAKYKPDWGRDCTHLICAFENTPKYNQVKGKGRIVKDTWVTDCYKKRTKLSWRKYRLGRAKSPDNCSSSEEDESDYVPSKRQKREVVKKPVIEDDDSFSPDFSESEEEKEQDSHASSKRQKRQVVKKSVIDDDGKLMSKLNPKIDDPYISPDSDSPNTEDELRKLDEQESRKEAEAKKSIYDESTDEGDGMDDRPANGNGDSDDDLELPDLPNFFDAKHFFFYGTLDAVEEKKLRRCIIAYGGEMDDYMCAETNYVISNSAWDENFDDAVNENANLAFVKPPWIFMCDEKQKIVPYQKFVIVPN
ncbi:hypothetical protein CAPTEDRAFT_181480 [Capitella teleta]|uniref:BRCT domain-containing protein n=1 Tax=Capitella teleta TaxID=283909 RepID=R7TLU1_CAPTE|nr:hypothetical protein CAPTEDRAFT_181480 [Capitella teleta]|eukprot:ELT92521.1 hypothetical protein CAPTEDRAFT_181480 [Capitella teleta]